ncbi:MAG: DmsC/YnfH family molybdoenzyme membrane anchor subunit, partial [Verrucomicrobiota bacterium]
TTVRSDYTVPTTRYLGLKDNVALQSGDEDDLIPAHGHFPLAWMLTLTQVATGLIIGDWILRAFGGGGASPPLVTLIVAFALAQAGLAGSISHLGRPLQAWRAFLGWRRSWLSREILAFGGWAGITAAYLASLVVGEHLYALPKIISVLAGGAASGAGLLGVYASVQVYADTQRRAWVFPITAFRFFSVTAVAVCLALQASVPAAIGMSGLLFFDLIVYGGFLPRLDQTSRLLRGPLRLPFWLRMFAGALAVGLVFLDPFAGWGALAIFFVSELIGRSLFFRSVDEWQMPGGILRKHAA